MSESEKIPNLIQRVIAPIGTTADRVMQEMQRINSGRPTHKREFIELEFIAFAGFGGRPDVPALFLRPDGRHYRCRTFSLKHERWPQDRFCLPIGTLLPERRFTHVAESVLVLIERLNHEHLVKHLSQIVVAVA